MLDTNFNDLPSQVVVHTFRQLPLRSLVATSVISHSWHRLVKQTLVHYDSLEDMGAYPPKVMQQVVCWAAMPGNLERLAGLSVSGDLFASIIDTLLRDDNPQPIWCHLRLLRVDKCKALTKIHLNKLLLACPSIDSLDLRNCQNLDDSSLKVIADRCPQLTSLNCSNWFHITTEGIKYLANRCFNLQNLVMDGCPHVASAALVAIAKHCKFLKTVSAVKCVRIGNKAAEALGSHTVLDHVIFRMCPKVNNVGVLGTVARLRTVDVAGCVLVTDSDVQNLLQNTGATIEHLYLNACINLTGQVLSVIGRLAPRLSVLRLGRVPIFNSDLEALVQHCTTLHEVGIEWCSRITDDGVTALVAANPQLECVSFEGVYLITDSVLTALGQHCPGLREVNLRLCNRLTQEAITQFVQGATALRTLHLGGMMDARRTSQVTEVIRLTCPHVTCCY